MGDIGEGDSREGDGGGRVRLSRLGGSFGGTGGGISRCFRRRGDLGSRGGRERWGSGGGEETTDS